jgi:hypothetical protein
MTLQGIAANAKVDLSPYAPIGAPAKFVAGSSPISYSLTLGSGQSGDSVSLTATGTNAGKLSASSVVTGAGGTATFVYTPSNTADAANCNTCSIVTATLIVSNHTYTYTAPAAPSAVHFALTGYKDSFPHQYNITSPNHTNAVTGLYAQFTTGGAAPTKYAIQDAFGNNVTAGMTFTSGTLSGGAFWHNTTSDVQVSNNAFAVTGALTDFGAAADLYDQGGAYGTTGTFTATIVGTYNSAGFSATGTSGTMFTSLFDNSANEAQIHGSKTVGSTVSVTYALSHVQSGVSVKLTAYENKNASLGFTDGKWAGGATAYAHTDVALRSSVTLTTGASGTASMSFVLPTQSGITLSFGTSITYSIDAAAPSTHTVTGVTNSTLTTAAGPISNFGVQVLYDGDAGSVASSAVAPSTVNVVAYITDSYGNLVANPGTQLQVMVSVSSGTLGATTPFIASNNKLTNDTNSFGLDAWHIPSSASGSLTVTASGLYTSATATITVVSPNPTLTLTSVNGKTYTSGTVYTHSSSVAVVGKAAVSAGYESGDVTVAHVYASLNAGAYASFAAASPWTYVNAVAFNTGSNTVAFKSGDSNGANSSATTINVVYDPNAPIITFPTSLIVASGQALTVTVTTTANDLNTTAGAIVVMVNGTATTNFSFAGSALTINGLTAGHHSVSVTASTLAGLSSTVSKVVTVTVNPGQSFAVVGTPGKATLSGYTGINVTYSNLNPTSQSVVVFAVWRSSTNAPVGIGTSESPVAGGASSSFFIVEPVGLAAGTYSVDLFVVTTGNLPVSITTTITVTV